MKPCRVACLILGAAPVLIAAMTATGGAQDITDDELRARTARYFSRLIDPAPNTQEIIDLFEKRVKAECAAITRATPDELREEEKWLSSLLRDAEVRLRRSSENLSHSADLLKRDAQDRAAQMDFRKSRADLADAQLELSLAASINARVGECIETQRSYLAEGELGLHGTWKADECHAADGITPDTTGRVTLQFVSDNVVRGMVYPTEGSIGVEVHGAMKTDRSFSLRTNPGRETVIELEGIIDQPYPFSGSGSIRFRGQVANYGPWECTGSWKSY